MGAVFEWLRPQLEMVSPPGGLCVSGGEPLLQIAGLLALLRQAKRAGISTAVETSGELPPGPVDLLAGWVDHWLFGLRSYPRSPGARPALSPLALANLDRILETGQSQVHIRFPLIPGYTDSPESISQVRQAMAQRHLHDLDILPFNPDTPHYYQAMGQVFDMTARREP